MKKQITLQQIENHIQSTINGRWGNDATGNIIYAAMQQAEEAGKIDLPKLFQKTHYAYLTKKETREVARIIKSENA